MKKQILLLLLGIALVSLSTFAQTRGFIFTTNSTGSVLDPNQDKYTSSSASGFSSDDISESEIPYYAFPVWFDEPTGDLRRGSDCNATDIVPDGNDDGFYMYFDGVNLLFRIRVGAFNPGAFGYNILIDTDMKFGNTGSDADVNYMPQTTGTNGNPGFELEVVWEKKFEVAIYDVDGESTTPTLLYSYSEDTHSQSSKSLSTNCGDPDYYMDFYVPIADLGISSSAPIRVVATTAMSPAPAIGGTKSDIYGIDDSQYPSIEEAFTKLILSQPGFSLTDIGNSGNGFDAVCTDAPTVSKTISTGETTISGNWESSSIVSNATIDVYKNNILIGTTTATSGGGWILSGITALVDGDIIYAKAIAVGESECLESNYVTVTNCTSNNIPATPTLDCISAKGASGTKTDGTTIDIHHFTGTGENPDGANYTTNLTNVSSETTWSWRSTTLGNTNFNDCGSYGGPNDVNDGSYYVTASSTTSGCESEISTVVCEGNNVNLTTTPTINEDNLFSSSTSISGICVDGSRVRLFVNGKLESVTTGVSSSFTFSALDITEGDVLEVSAQSPGECMSNFVSLVVSGVVSPPIISTKDDGNVAAGIAMAGVSSEEPNTLVTVYNATSLLSVGTATVQSDGTWVSNAIATVGDSYYAKQETSNGTSTASAITNTLSPNTNCPVINSPVTDVSTTISGTLASVVANTIVRLYLDEVEIGSVITSTNTWSIIPYTGYELYDGGLLVATTQVDGVNVESSCSQNLSVACSSPISPVITTNSFVICKDNTIATDISTESGLHYTLSTVDGLTDKGVTVLGDGSLISISSFEIDGSIDLLVEATKLGSSNCISNSAVISISVNEISGGIIEPNQTIIYGGDPNQITVQTQSVADGILSYQWQKSTSYSSGYVDIIGANNSSYDPPANIIETTYFKRIATSDLLGEICSEESNIVEVSIYNALPIELLEFTASKVNDNIQLYWSTATEINNNYFEIQRSNNEKEFVTIGKLESSVINSNEIVNYDYLDVLAPIGENYYRLKQVDLDGEFSYSNIQYVNNSEESIVKVFPNPVKDFVYLTLDYTGNKPVNVRITNLLGSVIIEKDLEAENNIQKIDTHSLPNGVYLIQVSIDSILSTRKIIISR